MRSSKRHAHEADRESAAQVEGHSLTSQQLLTFDDVANDQRKVIYQQRTELMFHRSPMRFVASGRGSWRHPRPAPPANISRGGTPGLAASIAKKFLDAGGSGAVAARPADLGNHARGRVVSAIDAMYDAVSGIGVPIMRHVEKDIMLKVLDQQWREHLAAWITAPGDHLRQR